MNEQTDIDRENPGPQTVYEGRAYEATITFLVPIDAPEAVIQEWLEYEIGGGSISLTHPLIDEEVKLEQVSGLRDLRYRRFTDWGPDEGEGSRHGRGRVERDPR